MNAAVEIEEVGHRYGQRQALANLSLAIRPAEIFALLGPNGSGKTTLFRLLSTLLPVQTGSIRILGVDVNADPATVRRQIGVVFQSPSLDKKLTVSENVRYQGQLYGLTGRQLDERERQMLARLGLTERANERAETLSGGLRRRVELAKGMLHVPRVLLLDEPSTGLDPAARVEMWKYLEAIARDEGVTIILTTHLLEEADRADRLAILDQGLLVALDTPVNLRRTVGGDTITIETENPEQLANAITERLAIGTQVIDGRVRLELADGHLWISQLVEAFPGRIRSITLSQPTLEDVFIARTGRRFWNREQEPEVGQLAHSSR